jgi:hypothetical protein
MRSVSQRFANVVKEGFNPILKQCGFKKKALHYYRKCGAIGHTINIQKDKWNTKESLKFTINIGIFSDKFWLSEYDYEEEKQIPQFRKEVESIIRERIGNLKYGKDFWYSIEPQQLEWGLIKKVKSDLEKYILPFLDSITTKKELIQYLKDNEQKIGYDFKLFITLAEEGMMEDAKEMIPTLIQNCNNENQLEYLLSKRKKYNL